MCMSQPKMPSMPEPQPLPKAAPSAPPMQRQPEMTPPPATANKPGEDGVQLKKRSTKRSQQQQAASGMSSLRIPLNTGSTGKAGAGGQGLNIPN